MGEQQIMVWEVTQLCVVWHYMRAAHMAQFWILKKIFLAHFTEYDTDIVHVVGEFLHDKKGEHRIKVGGDPIMGGMALYATAHVAQFWILKKNTSWSRLHSLGKATLKRKHQQEKLHLCHRCHSHMLSGALWNVININAVIIIIIIVMCRRGL